MKETKPLSNGKPKSMKLTIAAAVTIVAAAIVIVCLYRFTGIFVSRPTEKSIARTLDFEDPQWVDTLMEINLPSCEKDFSIYGAFSYSGEATTLTQVYATGAQLDTVRSYYLDLLENAEVSQNNSKGVLELEGTFNGRTVEVVNYYSELSTLIRVDMEMTGVYAAMIQRKIIDSFPGAALEAAPQIAAFASGESSEGYVMYDYNTFAPDIYANVPVFSRAYAFGGTLNDLKEKINSLGEQYTDPSNASISEGIAEIKSGAYLYQVKPVEGEAGVKAAVVIQTIPKN
jgi:hypothetical protein